MTRLEAALKGTKLQRDHAVDDVARLCEEIPELRKFKPRGVEDLYHEFSDRRYAAGWIILDEETLEEFRAWLNEEIK